MLLGKKIDMSVLVVNVIKLEEILSLSGEQEVVGIVVRVFGDIVGNILLVFEKGIVENIIGKLMGSK